MKRKEEFIDWSKLEGLMDKIYTLVEIDNEPKSLDSIVGYLLKKSKLSQQAAEKLARQIIQSLKEDRSELGEIKKCILFRKIFEFEDYQYWDRTLYHSAIEFREEYTLFPTIAILSKQTAARIDMIANNVHKDRILGEENQNPESDEFATLTSFETGEFSLEFAIDDTLPERKFILVFDSDPDWNGGEPKEEPEKIPKRKAA
ncbi:MAG: hypothetical protein IPO06_19755 [Leptospiraceae bacterium]|nr:hypothetical protein [Leptospiraceae bacterium]